MSATSIWPRLLENYHRYGPRPTVRDCFKTFAILLMIVDHLGYFFVEDNNWWRVAGRLCVPVWFFLVGYSRSSRSWHELAVLGFLLALADLSLGQPIFPLNIFATILATRLLLHYVTRRPQDGMTFACLVSISVLLLGFTLPFFEYGTEGFLLALPGFYYREYRDRALAPLSLALAWAGFSLAQIYQFNFNDLQSVVLMIGLGAVSLALRHYREGPLEGRVSVPLAASVKFLGRNSHYVYFFHFLVFLYLDYWLAAQKA